MSYLLASRVIRLLPPIALPVACLWAMYGVTLLSPGWQALLIDALPAISLASAMLLSIRFNRSRFSFLLLFLTLGWVSQTSSARPAAARHRKPAVRGPGGERFRFQPAQGSQSVLESMDC